MKKIGLPRFDMMGTIEKARKLASRHVDGLTINLPFVSFNVKPDATEKRVANEIVIRLADRRVLNASECCDDCIDQALASLQDIREILIDKQVELYGAKDGGLYLLLEMMAEALRQFLTFEQRLNTLHREPDEIDHPDVRRAPQAREAYFAALEALRGYFNRCLVEVAKIGGATLPKNNMMSQYETPWPVEAYVLPKLPALRGEYDQSLK